VSTSLASRPSDRLAYRQTEVARMLGISLPTWHRMRRDGVAPAPDLTYNRTPLWSQSTLDQWVANKLSAAP
jgi:predicted DNA-binding transcriptional regulator AlpA